MKNDGTYFLACQTQNKAIKKHHPPQVYPFEWEGIALFVHKVIDGTDCEKPLYSTMFWQVSEKSTGMSLSIKNAETILDAKKQSIAGLEKIGINMVSSL